MKKGLIYLLLLCIQIPTIGQSIDLPWITKVTTTENLHELHTIKTSADVTVSDGTRYTASTIYHDPQRAVFQTVHPDRQNTYGVEGMYYWSYDGNVMKEAGENVRDFTLGHQMFAQILYFDMLHADIGKGEDTQFNGKKATKYSSKDGWSMFLDKRGDPVGMTNAANDFLITFIFSDFRSVRGVKLPFSILIDDESRKFEYKFSTVLINEGSLDDFRPPLDKLTDEQQLLRLHRISMDDHWFERADGIKSLQADSLVYVSMGNVLVQSKEASGNVLDRIMASRYHTSYNDLIKPIVKVSRDATLGWVVAKIEAKGVRIDENGKETEPLGFTCSWIMLYEKIDGEWRCIGNSSTFP